MASMTSTSISPVAAATLVLMLSLVSAAEAKEPVEKAKSTTKAINPYGRPKDFIQRKGRMYGIWYEDGVWKLQTTSGRRVKIEFLGIVKIDKDKIVPDYAALDKGTRPRNRDLVLLSKDRREMKFKFITVGWTDGIDFKVGKKAKTVTFDLRTAGSDDPRYILIGAKGVHPAKGKFTLPAHPPKPPADSKESVTE